MIERRSSGRALSTASIWPWLMMTCCWRPTPLSLSSSWMSSSRHGTPLMAYSLSPLRNSVRVIVTSVNSMGSMPEPLSMVSETSARPRALRLAVPAKMTSSIFCERTALGAWAPSTQPMASTTLDLPLPLGPDHHGDAGFEVEHGRLGERLEPLQGQGLEIQLVSGGAGLLRDAPPTLVAGPPTPVTGADPPRQTWQTSQK